MVLLKKNLNLSCFLLVLGIYLTGQFLIGTRLPESGSWTLSAPIDRDSLYYAAQASQITIQTPPQESAYAGVRSFQSWLPLVPVAWLAPLVGPYPAMKLLTICALLIMTFLFRRYFPDHWGIVLLLVFITATPKLRVHSFSIDALFKGFYHLPFYIAFLVVLLEKKQQWLRYVCLAILPWLHAFSSIAALIFSSLKLVVYRDRQSVFDLLTIGGGTVLYKVLFFPSTTPPFQFVLDGLYFNPIEPLLHALLWLPFLFYCRSKDLWLLFCVIFALASLSHWQPFFFIYILEFATALMVVSSMDFIPRKIHRLFWPIACTAVVIFVLYATLIKFSRDAAVELNQFRGVLVWAQTQTPSKSVFLIAPPPDGRGETELPMIQQVRALFYGDPYVVAGVGLDPDGERYNAALQTYTLGIVPAQVDFVFYGPFERQRFPHFPGVGREVYRDSYVRVFDVRNRIAALPVTEQSARSKIPLWGTFEAAVINNRKYTDPFRETEMQATFTSPSGKSYKFFGFYDGDGDGGQTGNVWKLRFMCLEAGAWMWSAEFTDGASGASGSFECLKSTLPGPLRVNTSNTHWLVRGDGTPFLPRWYYLAELLFMREGEWQQYLEKFLVDKNYNMVSVVSIQAEHALANGWTRLEYEQPLFYPWIKKTRLTIGALLNLWPPRTHPAVAWEKPHLASWHKLDRILRYLQDRGIYYYNFDGLFPNVAPRFPDDPLKENQYLRYALARTGAYWNVVHNITFEFSEFMSTTRLNRIGRYVKEIDPFNILLTVHDTQNYDSLIRDEKWIDVANVQYDEGRAGSARIANDFALKHFRGKPVLSTEVVWEGGDKLDGDQVRKGAWGTLMAASAFLYGEFLPLNYGQGKAQPYLAIMLDFMESISFWTMNPHNELVNSGALCLADPGKEYVIFAEEGGPIDIDLSHATAPLRVEWLNPRTGERITSSDIDGGTKRRVVNPVDDRNDWVLHLRRLGRT
jgi:hypothetical protein